jgi:hypothetical protein
MPTNLPPPSDTELNTMLGGAAELWSEIIRDVADAHAPIDQIWRASKLEFRRVCLLQRKKRTLLYLIPESGRILAAIVFGERAYNIAMESALPAEIKTLLSEARPYAEGRGIRFTIRTLDDLPVIHLLLEIKTTP